MKLTYTNVNGYLIPNLTYKSGEQMVQLGKYGFLRRDYLKNHRNSTYQVMLLQDTILSSEQRRTADILGVFWILHDTGYAVSKISYAERKWWNRKVCSSIANPVCGRNHQYVQHFFTGFK